MPKKPITSVFWWHAAANHAIYILLIRLHYMRQSESKTDSNQWLNLLLCPAQTLFNAFANLLYGLVNKISAEAEAALNEGCSASKMDMPQLGLTHHLSWRLFIWAGQSSCENTHFSRSSQVNAMTLVQSNAAWYIERSNSNATRPFWETALEPQCRKWGKE